MLDLYLSAPSDRDDLPILLQTMPSLERLQLRFRPNDNIFDRIFRSPADGSIIPLGDASREMFLPCLQFMECTEPCSCDRVPQLYRQGHRRSLTLKFPTDRSQTSDETAMQLLELVDEGVKFQIIDTSENGDFLEQIIYRNFFLEFLGISTLHKRGFPFRASADSAFYQLLRAI